MSDETTDLKPASAENPATPEAESAGDAFAATRGQEPYKVRLDAFEGPLDLLLHLIKKNELDISNIAIAVITEQYLDYVDMMKSLNLEVAGEYLVMAATLAHIKSKSLLPSDSVPDEQIEDDEETEEMLIKRLLEYQKFKDAGEQLETRSWVGRDVFVRQEKLAPQVSGELAAVSLFTLVELFYERLKKLPQIFEHEVTLERITVAERIQEIFSSMQDGTRGVVPFEELLGRTRTRYDVIVTFLALLEMVRLSMIRLTQADIFSPILISRGERRESVQLEGVNYAE